MTKLQSYILIAIGILSNGNLYADSPAAFYSNLGDNEISWWGTSKAETYDVAVSLEASKFPGADISSIKFRIPDDPNITDCKVWISSSLMLDDDKRNVADIFSADVVPEDGYVSISLDSPQPISGEALYVGYSFSVGNVDDKTSKKPVAIANSGDTARHGMWLHSSRTYKKWMDYSASTGSWIPFEMTLTNLKKESVAIACEPDIYGAIGKPVSFDVVVTNHGYSPVASLTVAYEADGVSGQCEVECNGIPEGVYNYSTPVSITLPAFENTWNGRVDISIEKVNGNPNSDSAKKTELKLNVLSRLPKRTPLFEEYTGTGCGNCPRGIIGIERMRENFGENFIAVAYHCSDIMSIFNDLDSFPNYAPAQPTSWIDRIKETDPYFGDYKSGKFGLDDVWSRMAERFTPSDLTLTCRWTDDNMESIEAESSIYFAKQFDESDFRLVYILTSDGLKGEGIDWMQANYYSGEDGKWPSDFDGFVGKGRYIMDMEYNHVAIFSTPKEGIAGVIPSAIEADQTFGHSQILKLSDAVNIYGQSLIQDKNRIGVVAAILDANTGEIINCAYATPQNTNVGKLDTEQSSEIAPYFNLQGIEIANPTESGIYIHKGKKIIYQKRRG